jgi:hypothetical protein
MARLSQFTPEGEFQAAVETVHDCRWIAFSYMPFFDHVASEFTQTEVSPLFKAQQG